MSIALSPAARHTVAAANSHCYHNPTAPLYLDRVLPCHDFIYLAEGQWTITENDTDFPLSCGDVLLLSSGHHHYTRLPCAPDTRTMCLHVSSEPGDAPDAPGALILPTLIHAAGFPRVKARFEEIVAVAWQSRTHRQDRLSALVQLLLLDLADVAAAGRPENPPLADEVIRLVSETPNRNRRMDELEALLGVSAKTINAALQARTGMTFSRYQAGVKLDMAAQQLRMEPDISLREIADMFGFCDEFHFSKAFRAKYGVPPSRYRSAGRAEPEAPPSE